MNKRFLLQIFKYSERQNISQKFNQKNRRLSQIFFKVRYIYPFAKVYSRIKTLDRLFAKFNFLYFVIFSAKVSYFKGL